MANKGDIIVVPAVNPFEVANVSRWLQDQPAVDIDTLEAVNCLYKNRHKLQRHGDAVYFVLRVDLVGRRTIQEMYDRATARCALRTYADLCSDAALKQEIYRLLEDTAI